MGIPQIQQQEIARRKSRENSPSQPGKVRCGFFLTAANQQPEKNPGISRNCPWHFRKIGYNRSVPQGNIEDLCNGSTPDSDSVCGGSNPSSSAMKKALASASAFFNEINPLRDLWNALRAWNMADAMWNACGREWIYFRLHRIIRQGSSARDFVPVQSFKNGGILYVFPVFETAEMVQKIRWDPQTQLCGVAFISLSASAENFTSAYGAYFTFCKAKYFTGCFVLEAPNTILAPCECHWPASFAIYFP